MTVDKLNIICHSPEKTKELGQLFGEEISEGMLIGLTGDLGSGKTVFVQGLAKGLQVPSDFYITSPSYTLINEYPGRLKLFHVDLYRLDEPVDMEELGLYDIIYGNHVTAIEWVERLHENITGAFIKIKIDTMDENNRNFSISSFNMNNTAWMKVIQNKFKE